MSERKVVIFEMDDADDEEPLIREYIVPAFHQLESREEIRWLMFNRYGADPSVDGGEVTFYLFGDVETIAAEERQRWDALVADGFAEEWWTDDTEVRISELNEQELLRHRMRAMASRSSVAFFETFDELPDSVNEFNDTENFSVGWWICLHHMINQLGYQANEGEEEIDLLFENLRNRLYALASGVDTPRAEAKIDELVTELEAHKPALREHIGEGGDHEHLYVDREAFEEE
jgi:hypothetical protein